MAEDKSIEPDDETTNDYTITNREIIDYHTIVSDFGTETLIIFRVERDGDYKVLRYHGREIIKVIYTGPDGVTIKQGFYRSTGRHTLDTTYKGHENINTEGTWVPFDGIGYYDINYIVTTKSNNRNSTRDDYLEWKKRDRMLFKCDYFGNALAYRFGEAVDPEVGLSKYYAFDRKMNKNFDLVRYGDLRTFRISYLLSSGDKTPFWSSPLGQRMINELGWTLNDIEFNDETGLPESAITITNDYVEAEHREVNNFIADFISFNHQDSSEHGQGDFKKRRKNRPYDLRYSYMPTAKGTWVMFKPYLETNPDSRLSMEEQSIESKKIKEAYDIVDSDDFRGPFSRSYKEVWLRDD